MVFKGDTVAAIEGNIRRLCERTARSFELNLSHDEARNIITSPDDLEALKAAEGRVGIISPVTRIKLDVSTSEFAIGSTGSQRCYLNISFHGDPPLLPARPVWQQSRYPDLTQQIIKWMAQRIDIGERFAVLQKVVNELNDACDTLKQIRYLFPGIVPVLRYRDDTSPLADSIIELKRPNKLPTLPVEFRNAIREASATVAMAQLVPEELDKRDTPPVTLKVTTPTFYAHGWELGRM